MSNPEVTLGQIPFHWILIPKKGFKVFLVLLLLLGAVFLLKYFKLINNSLGFLIFGIILLLFSLYLLNLWQRWRRSGLTITDQKLCLVVHHKIFGHYAMDLYYSQVRDTASTYPNMLAGLLQYDNFIVRSGIEDLQNTSGMTVNGICHPDKVKNYVNYILGLSEEKRAIAVPYAEFEKNQGKNTPKPEEKIQLALQTLKSVKGIKAVGVLNQDDLDYIWKNEEEKNIGVFETLKRKIVLVCTHDEKLRPPADEIVLNRGERHVFPAVPFPELKEKNVVSCSPGKNIHEYLSKKIAVEPNDGTLLIGFDI